MKELTKRQKEITVLIAEGLCSKEIAREIGCSIKTVETHRANILDRLGLPNSVALVRYAIRTGLVEA